MKEVRLSISNFFRFAPRTAIIFLYRISGKDIKLFQRTDWTAIGFTGYVSLPDHDFAKLHKLKPLNRFERWLMKPIIEAEQTLRRDSFRQACLEVLGEDPNDW